MSKDKSQITYRSVNDLIPYARNARTHSDEQVLQIASSIKEFGFTNPVLIDSYGGIIAGHGRVMAARKIGLESVPTIELTHLTEIQKRAYIIADNKMALNAGWDIELLSVEFESLKDVDFDLDLTGFGGDEIKEIISGPDVIASGNTDPDDVPELQEKIISKPGDIWILGNHRLMCGDSTSADDVADLLDGAVPHLMVTDPPYGVEYDPTRTSDNPLKAGKVLNDDRADWSEAWSLFPGDVAYVWHASIHTCTVMQSLNSCGFEHRSLIIWAKDRFTLGRGHYHWQHEPAWYVVKKGGTGHWNGDRSQSTLWTIKAREDNGWGHGTQKPVECMLRPMINNSKPGDAVYEPFSGSGTSIIAAEQSGRICYAMELNPAYVDLAVRRWQEFTGGTAHLEYNGEAFLDS